jgi:acetyl-CoA acetyltransferase
VEILGFGMARVEAGFMPMAPSPAAFNAVKHAGLTIADVHAIKTHNPFAVNDIALARDTGFAWERMNNYGSSIIWGHPQAPTGMRAIIELIEELVLRGGGVGLFTGCAAGDTGYATVIRVTDSKTTSKA